MQRVSGLPAPARRRGPPPPRRGCLRQERPAGAGRQLPLRPAGGGGHQLPLRLIPRKLRVGLGCRRGTEQAAIETAVRQVFRENRLALAAISGVSSIDLKQDEPGLLAACRANGWQARFYSAAQLRAVPGSFTGSRFVASVTGVDNVCERAALYGGGRLLVQKQALGGVTVAVAEEPWEVRFG